MEVMDTFTLTAPVATGAAAVPATPTVPATPAVAVAPATPATPAVPAMDGGKKLMKTPLNKRSSMERLTSTIMKMKEFHQRIGEQERADETVAEVAARKTAEDGDGQSAEMTTKMELDRLEILMGTDRR